MKKLCKLSCHLDCSEVISQIAKYLSELQPHEDAQAVFNLEHGLGRDEEVTGALGPPVDTITPLCYDVSKKPGGVAMVRAQIILDEETYRRAKLEAYRKGKSMSAVVRDELHERWGIGAKNKKSRKKPLSSKDFAFIGAATTGKPDNVSERHDEELGKGRW
jgi:hypothetical protein